MGLDFSKQFDIAGYLCPSWGLRHSGEEEKEDWGGDSQGVGEFCEKDDCGWHGMYLSREYLSRLRAVTQKQGQKIVWEGMAADWAFGNQT